MKEMSFEQSVEQLEEIVKQLEQGGLSLEKSLALYETGVKLSYACQQKLERAKLKLEEIDLPAVQEE